MALLAGTSSQRMEKLVKQRGVSFNPTEDYLQSVKSAGGRDTLLESLRAAGKTAPPEGSSASPASIADTNKDETEILAHVARGAELRMGRSYEDAVKEFRAALKIDPDNGVVHFALASVLHFEGEQKPTAEVTGEYHKAIELQPDFPDAHLGLAHFLSMRKDVAGAMTEYHVALRLEPGNVGARSSLGLALEETGDLDGAINVFQEGVGLLPQSAGMHYLLGQALEKKGDENAAQEHLRIAASLPPSPDTPARIRVGGQVESSKLIFRPSPDYPPEARHARITGIVRLDVVIGRDGTVLTVKLISGHPLLAEAAIAAVRMWRYQPTLLNGEPVEVASEIDVNFTLKK